MTMIVDKRKKLESKGWKVGTVEEFLSLTPEESLYIEIKLKLSKTIKQRRVQKHISQTAMARLIKSSQSRVAKIEAGDPSVSIDLLIRAALALGASKKEVAKAIA